MWRALLRRAGLPGTSVSSGRARTHNLTACIDPASGFTFHLLKSPFINVDEKIDKTVGRRTRTPDMELQALAVELHRSLRHHWAPTGVYRFKTHEEADEWMNRMLARSQRT